MLVIKRYPNRKLYDTEAKQYITLDIIADMIRNGKDVQVIDYASGEDLTALTLSQIIFEQEKRQSGFLPRSILTNLIQAGGDKVSAFQRNLMTPKGFLQKVDEEIKHRISTLIAQGEILEAEGERWLEKLISPGSYQDSPLNFLDSDLERIIQAHEIPTREEVEHISDQLELLSAQLDDLSRTDA